MSMMIFFREISFRRVLDYYMFVISMLLKNSFNYPTKYQIKLRETVFNRIHYNLFTRGMFGK